MPLSPNTGPSSGGTAVTITGSNLANASAVRFGLNLATITSNTTTQINVISPAGHGVAPVTVTTPSGTSNAVPYYYIEPPTKSAVSPNLGAAAGGDVVTITGSNLSNATVTFGATAGTVTANSPGSITVTSPAGTGTVPITVTTAGGSTNGFSFTYIAAPAITTISPGAGPATGGTNVTITGAGLTYTTAVRFDSTPASFVVRSDTSIDAVTPPGTGLADVTVSTAGGAATLVDAFQYVSGPGI